MPIIVGISVYLHLSHKSECGNLKSKGTVPEVIRFLAFFKIVFKIGYGIGNNV